MRFLAAILVGSAYFINEIKAAQMSAPNSPIELQHKNVLQAKGHQVNMPDNKLKEKNTQFYYVSQNKPKIELQHEEIKKNPQLEVKKQEKKPQVHESQKFQNPIKQEKTENPREKYNLGQKGYNHPEWQRKNLENWSNNQKKNDYQGGEKHKYEDEKYFKQYKNDQNSRYIYHPQQKEQNRFKKEQRNGYGEMHRSLNENKQSRFNQEHEGFQRSYQSMNRGQYPQNRGRQRENRGNRVYQTMEDYNKDNEYERRGKSKFGEEQGWPRKQNQFSRQGQFGRRGGYEQWGRGHEQWGRGKSQIEGGHRIQQRKGRSQKYQQYSRNHEHQFPYEQFGGFGHSSYKDYPKGYQNFRKSYENEIHPQARYQNRQKQVGRYQGLQRNQNLHDKYCSREQQQRHKYY